MGVTGGFGVLGSPLGCQKFCEAREKYDRIAVDGNSTFYALLMQGGSLGALVVAKRIAQFLGDPSDKLDLIWDGKRSAQKHDTSLKRLRKHSKDDKDLVNHCKKLEQILDDKKKITKDQWRKLEQLKKSTFDVRKFSTEVQKILAGEGYECITADYEADVYIANQMKTANPYAAVLARDSDMLYHLVPVVMFPIYGTSGKVNIYQLDKVLESLHLNPNQFQALGIVCKNDYSNNVYGYNFQRNVDEMRAIREEDLGTQDTVVVAYVKSYVAEINKKEAEKKKREVNVDRFENAISIFVRGEETARTEKQIEEYNKRQKVNAPDALKKFEKKLEESKRERKENQLEKEYKEKRETRARLNENNYFPLTWADNSCRSIGFKDMEGKGTPKARYSHQTKQSEAKIVPARVSRNTPTSDAPTNGSPANGSPTSDSQDAPTSGSRKKTTNGSRKKTTNCSRKKSNERAKSQSTNKLAMNNIAKRKRGGEEESNPKKKPRVMTLRQKIKRKLNNQAMITLKIGALHSNVKDEVALVIRDLTVFINVAKRKAVWLFCYFIEDCMNDLEENGRRTSTKMLDDILLAGSDGNKGREFWNGLFSSIVIHRKTDNLPLKILNQIAKMPNVEKYYLTPEELKKGMVVGSISHILEETTTELVTNCKNLYIGQLPELARRVREYYQGQGKQAADIEKELHDILDDKKKSEIEKFWRLNTILPKNDQIAYYFSSSIKDSFVTFTELGLLECLGSEFKEKNPSPIYMDYSEKIAQEEGEKNPEKEKEIGRFMKYLFANLGKRNYARHFCLIDEYDENNPKRKRYVLGTSFRTDGHSVSVLLYDMKKKKKKLNPGNSEASVVELSKILQRRKRPISDELPEDYNPDWIVGVDNGVRYAAGVFALELKTGVFKTLTINSKALFDPTWKHNQWLLEQKKLNVESLAEKKDDDDEEVVVTRASDDEEVVVIRASDYNRIEETTCDPKDINELEADMARRDGESAFDHFMRYWEAYKPASEFYNSPQMKGRRADLEKAKRGEFDIAVNSILKMVGKNMGAKSDGKRDADFNSTGVGSSFSKYLVMKLRSLDYPCIFVDEYNTSQMCPICKETYTDFVKKCHLRIKYCSNCEKYFHRDVMAAENIVNKGLSQIYGDKSIASYLGERPKKDNGESDSESQKKSKGKRKRDNSSSAEDSQTKRKMHCGICREAGHNRNKCPNSQREDNAGQLEEDNSPGPSNSQKKGKRKLDNSQSEGDSQTQRKRSQPRCRQSDDSEEVIIPVPSNSKGKRKLDDS